jgi:hypothetical protein
MMVCNRVTQDIVCEIQSGEKHNAATNGIVVCQIGFVDAANCVAESRANMDSTGREIICRLF